MVGTGKGAQMGILIKDASALEKVGNAKIIVFDKTGTLTKNQITVNAIKSFNNAAINDILTIAASLEKKSEHPIAKAIIKNANEQKAQIKKVTNFKNFEGMGIKGEIEKKECMIGNLSLMKKHKIGTKIVEKDFKKLQEKGDTVIIVACRKKAIGLIALSDEIKDDAQEAIKELKKKNYEIYMITGDNLKSAKSVADKIGITNVLSEIMPKEKANIIKELQKLGGVIMVGDGINDSVALTQADIGIAIGSGTDAAIEAGQIILVKSKVTDVVKALKLSNYTLDKIKQNLFWAFFYNILGIPIAAGILYPSFGLLINPIRAALAMSLSSVSVVANSLLTNYKKI
jgi:heavy metal translocating P-type ATPase